MAHILNTCHKKSFPKIFSNLWYRGNVHISSHCHGYLNQVPSLVVCDPQRIVCGKTLYGKTFYGSRFLSPCWHLAIGTTSKYKYNCASCNLVTSLPVHSKSSKKKWSFGKSLACDNEYSLSLIHPLHVELFHNCKPYTNVTARW